VLFFQFFCRFQTHGEWIHTKSNQSSSAANEGRATSLYWAIIFQTADSVARKSQAVTSWIKEYNCGLKSIQIESSKVVKLTLHPPTNGRSERLTQQKQFCCYALHIAHIHYHLASFVASFLSLCPSPAVTIYDHRR
jgi:hypothetical protein